MIVTLFEVEVVGETIAKGRDPPETRDFELSTGVEDELFVILRDGSVYLTADWACCVCIDVARRTLVAF